MLQHHRSTFIFQSRTRSQLTIHSMLDTYHTYCTTAYTRRYADHPQFGSICICIALLTANQNAASYQNGKQNGRSTTDDINLLDRD